MLAGTTLTLPSVLPLPQENQSPLLLLANHCWAAWSSIKSDREAEGKAMIYFKDTSASNQQESPVSTFLFFSTFFPTFLLLV